MIHISCGQRLHELCKNPVEPMWAEGLNHQVWKEVWREVWEEVWKERKMS